MAFILIVEDDTEVAQTIELRLTHSGHQAVIAANGYEALQRVRRLKPDLMLLDIGMPEMDGLEVCRRLRATPATAAIPILFITARGGIESKIEGFDAGADDYLVKPFNLQELELRIRALLRRTSPDKSGPAARHLAVGRLRLDCQTFQVTVDERKALLTPVEFELLHFSMSHAGQVFSSEELLREVWRYPPGTGSPDLVRMHIKNLREKIELDPKAPIFLKTVGRFGYTIGTG